MGPAPPILVLPGINTAILIRTTYSIYPIDPDNWRQRSRLSIAARQVKRFALHLAISGSPHLFPRSPHPSASSEIVRAAGGLLRLLWSREDGSPQLRLLVRNRFLCRTATRSPTSDSARGSNRPLRPTTPHKRASGHVPQQDPPNTLMDQKKKSGPNNLRLARDPGAQITRKGGFDGRASGLVRYVIRWAF